MGIEGEPPTPEQVAYIRNKISNYIDDNGQDVFDSRDINRIRTEDAYVERFFMHVYDLPGSQEDNAVNMAVNTFKWRKELKVNDVTMEQLNPRLKGHGELYVHGRDKDGKVLMVFAVKKHIKGTEKMDDLKTFFIYMMERIDRENNGDQLTLVFDCAGCGLKNMDMELIQYMIQVFKDYYPWSLNYILVFEMPWVLNAAWKIIKTWLPAGAVKKIKFLTKGNIGEYVADDQRPPAWGGTDDWEYQWEDEEVTEDIRIPTASFNGDLDYEDEDEESAKSSLTNGGVIQEESNARKKSVSFATTELRNSISVDSISSQSNVVTTNGSAPIPIPVSSSSGDNAGSPPVVSLAPLLSITPSDEIVFSKNSAGDLTAKVTIKNISTKSIAFKIRTTSPEKFRVRPSMASLQPGSVSNIEIHVHSSHLPQGSSGASSVGQIVSILVKDKFLFTATSIPADTDATLSHAQLTEVMKNLRPEAQYRLRCTFSGPQDLGKGSALAGQQQMGANDVKLQKQMESLTRKVTHMTEMQESMQASIDSLKKFVLLILLLVAVMLVLTYLWSVHPSTTEKLFKEICHNLGDLASVQASSLNGPTAADHLTAEEHTSKALNSEL